jgi:hypothetical protein
MLLTCGYPSKAALACGKTYVLLPNVTCCFSCSGAPTVPQEPELSGPGASEPHRRGKRPTLGLEDRWSSFLSVPAPFGLCQLDHAATHGSYTMTTLELLAVDLGVRVGHAAPSRPSPSSHCGAGLPGEHASQPSYAPFTGDLVGCAMVASSVGVVLVPILPAGDSLSPAQARQRWLYQKPLRRTSYLPYRRWTVRRESHPQRSSIHP